MLLSTAKSSHPGTVRIVTVSSIVAYFGKLDFNTFKDSPVRRKRPTYALYHQSKLVRE
jgi:retinol dehydrogenase-12